MRRLLAAVVCVSCQLGSPFPCADERSRDPRVGPTVGGRLIWDLDDDLELLGDLFVDLPFRLSATQSIFAAVDTRTSIRRTTSEFAFDVRDLDYSLALGWRRLLGRSGRRQLSVFVGQRGKQRVDADGQPWARFLAVGIGSTGSWSAPGSSSRWSWKLAGGPVVDEREVAADVVLGGQAGVDLAPRRSPGRGFRLDAKLDGLIDGGRSRLDLSGGPGFAYRLRGGRSVLLFLHYQRSRNPLGIGHSALLAGFEYSGRSVGRSGSFEPPQIEGLLAAGGGERGRLAGQLKLRFLSPGFAGGTRFAFLVDANILTASDTGDLYYFYHLGAERPLGNSLIGGYFYHRSNHQLAEPNDRVTSINVVEGGIESERWEFGERRPTVGAWGSLDARVRIGYLINSSFGEDRRFHVRGGVRWNLPLFCAGVAPYLLLEVEGGDVERHSFAIGVRPRDQWAVQLELRRDDQYFASDDDALLLTGRFAF